MDYASDLAQMVGNTPLIKLRRASEETGCTILGKAEFMNPGQSVKDRAALFIIRDAIEKGLLQPGGTIVEGTAGNTGIGLALVGASLGYKTVIVIPETQSQEKKDEKQETTIKNYQQTTKKTLNRKNNENDGTKKRNTKKEIKTKKDKRKTKTNGKETAQEIKKKPNKQRYKQHGQRKPGKKRNKRRERRIRDKQNGKTGTKETENETYWRKSGT